jgi:hypothetical protein
MLIVDIAVKLPGEAKQNNLCMYLPNVDNRLMGEEEE